MKIDLKKLLSLKEAASGAAKVGNILEPGPDGR
jgi:hypothetical protein